MSSRVSRPTVRPSASATGNSCWLVRSSASTASATTLCGDRLSKRVIMASPTIMPCETWRIWVAWASEEAAR